VKRKSDACCERESRDDADADANAPPTSAATDSALEPCGVGCLDNLPSTLDASA